MLPRYRADYRTLLWTAIPPLLIAVQYARPDWVIYLCWMSCYFALACGVIAHNHNHCPTFKGKRMNQWFGTWLSIFYGYPTFAWIPTHNLNHHKYVNRAGDATITWRYTNRHNALVAATYFFVSSYFQSEPIKQFIRNAREKNPRMYRRIMTQYAVWLGAHVTMLAVALFVHGLGTGLYVYGLSMLLPAFFALWTIMLFNYEQHVHADPWSEHNHSRSWEGRLLNFMLFNNGYHAAHHEHPGTHWSELGRVHYELVDKIDPALVVRGSLWGYFAKQYLLAPIFPRFGSKQVGRAPFDDPRGKADPLQCAPVGLGEAGSNAEMAPRPFSAHPAE